MDISISERRQIENEMIFRRKNEKVSDGLDMLDQIHAQDDHPELIRDEAIVLHFYCECSDENCNARIPIKVIEYQNIHMDRDAFIVKPNHQVDPIETVIRIEPEYNVVQKNNTVPEPGKNLNITPINNS